jgi:hypothetical protein
MTITEMLNQLAEMRATVDFYRMTWEQRRNEILVPVKTQLIELDAEFEPMVETAQERIAEMEAQVKQAVLQHGASVKGNHLQAVWMKGRTSWDTRKLDGLMIALPQLKECRSEGTPSVSIRTVG